MSMDNNDDSITVPSFRCVAILVSGRGSEPLPKLLLPVTLQLAATTMDYSETRGPGAETRLGLLAEAGLRWSLGAARRGWGLV